MALIKCPECGKDVSDRATVCIHCGYPIASTMLEQNRLVSVLSNTNEVSHSCQSPTVSIANNFYLFSADEEYVNIECKNCGKIYKYNRRPYFSKVTAESCVTTTKIRCANCGNITAENSKILPKQKITIFDKKQLKQSDVLCCPKCKSTAVTTGQRGFSFWTGFLGSNKTVNRCGKCGHSWEPK